MKLRTATRATRATVASLASLAAVAAFSSLATDAYAARCHGAFCSPCIGPTCRRVDLSVPTIQETKKVNVVKHSGRTYGSLTEELWFHDQRVLSYKAWATFTGRIWGVEVSTPYGRTECVWDGSRGAAVQPRVWTRSFNSAGSRTYDRWVTTSDGSPGFARDCVPQLAATAAASGARPSDLAWMANTISTRKWTTGPSGSTDALVADPMPNAGAWTGAISAAGGFLAAGFGAIAGAAESPFIFFAAATGAGVAAGVTAWGVYEVQRDRGVRESPPAGATDPGADFNTGPGGCSGVDCDSVDLDGGQQDSTPPTAPSGDAPSLPPLPPPVAPDAPPNGPGGCLPDAGSNLWCEDTLIQ